MASNSCPASSPPRPCKDAELVIVVNAETRTVELHDRSAGAVVDAAGILAHPALSGFALSVKELFETIALPR